MIQRSVTFWGDPDLCPICGEGRWYRDTDGRLKMTAHDTTLHPGKNGKSLADL